MSEVNGFMIFKLPKPVLDKISDDDQCINHEVVNDIIKSAGIVKDFDEKLFLVDLDLTCDGIEKRSDFLFVYPFDEHFMYLGKLLAEHGKGIELYSVISHEYGVSGFYILDAEGNRFVESVDIESEEDVDPAEIHKQFLKRIPKSIKTTFDDIFS